MYKISFLICLAALGSYGNVLKRQGKYHIDKVLIMPYKRKHSSISIITLENKLTESCFRKIQNGFFFYLDTNGICSWSFWEAIFESWLEDESPPWGLMLTSMGLHSAQSQCCMFILLLIFLMNQKVNYRLSTVEDSVI